MTDASRSSAAGSSAGDNDEAIATAAEAQQKRGESSDASAARAFDIRRVIGGLFVLYGVVVFAAGLFDGAAAREQAAGININLWAGLGMFLLGAFFLIWMRLNPLPPVQPRKDDRPAH